MANYHSTESPTVVAGMGGRDRHSGTDAAQRHIIASSKSQTQPIIVSYDHKQCNLHNIFGQTRFNRIENLFIEMARFVVTIFFTFDFRCAAAGWCLCSKVSRCICGTFRSFSVHGFLRANGIGLHACREMRCIYFVDAAANPFCHLAKRQRDNPKNKLQSLPRCLGAAGSQRNWLALDMVSSAANTAAHTNTTDFGRFRARPHALGP